MSFPYDPNYFKIADPFIKDNENLRVPQIEGYFSVYDHFMIRKKTTSAIVVLPTGERVIIVMGAVCVIKSRVSETLNKYISCIA